MAWHPHHLCHLIPANVDVVLQAAQDTEPNLNVDCTNLYDFDNMLYRQLVNYPGEVLSIFDEEVRQILREMAREDWQSVNGEHELHVRLPPADKPVNNAAPFFHYQHCTYACAAPGACFRGVCTIYDADACSVLGNAVYQTCNMPV